MTRSGFEYSISEPDRISEAENTTHWKVGALLQPSQSKIYLDSKLETRKFFQIGTLYFQDLQRFSISLIHCLTRTGVETCHITLVFKYYYDQKIK